MEAWTLTSQYGGRDIEIPLGVSTNTFLHRAIPPACANALIEYWAGKKLSVPKNDKIAQQIRNQRIFLARSKGIKVVELAVLFDLSRRSIITICAQMAAKQAVKHGLNK